MYPSGRKLPPQRTNGKRRAGCATTRRYNGPPHSYHPNFNPSGTVAVSVTANFSCRIHAWILHIYLKPIAPPRAPYHWLLPQFFAQWYSLARAHLLFRSATRRWQRTWSWVERKRERDRGKGGGWRSGSEVGKVVGGKVPRFCQGSEYYCRASPTGAVRDGNELLEFAKRWRRNFPLFHVLTRADRGRRRWRGF